MAPALPALAARKGDVKAESNLTFADSLVVLRSFSGQITLTTTQRTDADVAPLVNGEPVGDGRVDANDANLMLRAAKGVDVDGLTGDQEKQSGTWPLDPDSDDDGYADGDDPLPLLAAGTLVAYVHTDHLGSVAVLTDTTGTVVRRLRYQVFGQLKSNVLQSGAPATTLDPAQKYTGQQLDDDTGLYYYGARYYDAQYGRFVTADTIVPEPLDPQSLNRYAYGRNSPLNATDPSGHDPLWDYGIGEWADHGLDLDQFDLGGGDDFDFGGYEYDWDTEFSSFGSSGYHVLDFGSSSGSSSFELAMGSASYVFDISPSSFQGSQGVQELPPIAVPNAPPGVSVDANILETMRLSRLDPEATLVDWVNKVREGGQWDYKRLEPVGAYEEFGNFNYGATGRALGFPREVLLRAAGFVQVLESLRTGRPHGPGSPFGESPYGDFPEDQGPILRGTGYYDRNFWGRRLDVR